jgi:hypothetical protein
MACVMALQEGWISADGKVEQPEFVVNGDFKGLRDSVNDGRTSAFMWEWFTTKPYQDSGEVKFIGSVLTPWPSWMIACSTDASRAPPQAVKAFLDGLSGYVRAFDSEEGRAGPDVEYLKKSHGYPEEDIRAWLKTVKYVQDCKEIDGKVLVDTLTCAVSITFVWWSEKY